MSERGPDWSLDNTGEHKIIKAYRSGSFRVVNGPEKIGFDLKTWLGIVGVVVASILGVAKIGHYFFYTRLEAVLLEHTVQQIHKELKHE